MVHTCQGGRSCAIISHFYQYKFVLLYPSDDNKTQDWKRSPGIGSQVATYPCTKDGLEMPK